MRLVERHPAQKIARNDENDARLSEWMTVEIENAFTARQHVEFAFIEAMRQYEAQPRQAVRDAPVPNAPNIEIPLGAMLTDDLYAQATDTLFTASPLVSVRATSAEWVEHAKALQAWVNILVDTELDFSEAANHALLNDTKLGTGVYYIPWVESLKKTRTHKVTDRRARVHSIQPQDFLVPPGSEGNHQTDLWVALRFWYTSGELAERARVRGWDIDGVQAVAQFDPVRMRANNAARLRGTGTGPLFREVFEVMECYAYFDYDQDGYEEDLLVTWDRASRKILKLQYNPYDKRPIEVMRYQLRGDLPYGLGVMEMTQPFQVETTELHCYNLLNVFLANAKLWAADQGRLTEQKLEVWPGKVVGTQGNPNEVIKELKMSEVHPSALAGQIQAMQLAERRVGTTGSQGFQAKGGSRTPGVTALSLLQQVNKRFAPAFTGMRDASSAAVAQGVQRYRERILANDVKVEEDITNRMGEEAAALIVEVLRSNDFDQGMQIQFTASSASINREADRQNAMLLVQILGQYYQRTVELTALAAAPETPQAVREVVLQVAQKGTEIMDRTIRTFEQVRDPATFLLDVEDELTGATEQMASQAGILEQLLGVAGGGPIEPSSIDPEQTGVA